MDPDSHYMQCPGVKRRELMLERCTSWGKF